MQALGALILIMSMGQARLLHGACSARIDSQCYRIRQKPKLYSNKRGTETPTLWRSFLLSIASLCGNGSASGLIRLWLPGSTRASTARRPTSCKGGQTWSSWRSRRSPSWSSLGSSPHRDMPRPRRRSSSQRPPRAVVHLFIRSAAGKASGLPAAVLCFPVQVHTTGERPAVGR